MPYVCLWKVASQCTCYCEIAMMRLLEVITDLRTFAKRGTKLKHPKRAWFSAEKETAFKNLCPLTGVSSFVLKIISIILIYLALDIK